MRVRTKCLGVAAGAALLLMTSFALAGGTGTITGENGHTATSLFDLDDVMAMPEWDRMTGWLGSTNWNQGLHTVAADSDSTVYVTVRAQDDTDESTVVGIVAGSSAATLETVYRIQYDGSGDFDMPAAIGLATFSVGSGAARIDEGDIVLLNHTLRNYDTADEYYGTLLQVFDPSDADGTIRTLYETDEYVAGDVLLDPTTKTLIIPRGDFFERLSYDPDEGAQGGFVLSTTFIDDPLTKGATMWALDSNGDLHTDTYERIDGKDDWFVTKIEGATGDILDARFANPKGAPNNYAKHKIGGFAFDASDKFWLADWIKSKSPDHFISKKNKKGKIPYKRRIAGWGKNGTANMKTLQMGLDGVLYSVVQGDSGAYAVWAID